MNRDESTTYVVWLDNVLLLLFGFVLISVLVVLLVNKKLPPQEGEVSPGNVIIEVRWPDSTPQTMVCDDVDVWIKTPGDKKSVGYSRKDGSQANLLRDDLGCTDDVTPLNYENAYTRGIFSGEYVVNVKLYSIHDPAHSGLPLEVTVTASVKRYAGDSTHRIIMRKVLLTKEKEEITAFRFMLKKDGNLVEGSINENPETLSE